MIRYTLAILSGGELQRWPIDNFVKENDFTGKTVIPFCTATDLGNR